LILPLSGQRINPCRGKIIELRLVVNDERLLVFLAEEELPKILLILSILPKNMVVLTTRMNTNIHLRDAYGGQVEHSTSNIEFLIRQ
jgi:hypothetical protein